MKWKIYNMIMAHYNSKDFCGIGLHVRILLLAVTRAKISEILMLKIGYLRILERIFIARQNLFIQNSKIRTIISARETDFKYFHSIKNDKDLIFNQVSI